jgi:hypothetical protein
MTSSSAPIPDEEELNRLYGEVLDAQLLPTHIRDRLIASESREKKWQTITIQQSSNQQLIWGEREQRLLKTIKESAVRGPDIRIVIDLERMIATANKSLMTGFLGDSGIDVIAIAMRERLARVPMREQDGMHLVRYYILFRLRLSLIKFDVAIN